MPCLDFEQVGLRIRSQRTSLGYTREQLAERLGVTPKFCSDIELGHKGMSLQTLCKLSDILGVSTDYILFGRQTNGSCDPIYAMLGRCPAEHLPYARRLLKLFLEAIGR